MKTNFLRLCVAIALMVVCVMPAQADLLSQALHAASGAATHAAIRTVSAGGNDRVAPSGAGTQSVVLQGQGTVEVAFSPNGAATDATVRFIGEAQRSILVAAYGLTSNPIGKALVQARQRGVDVRVVVDKDYNGRSPSPNSVVNFLASSGIPVRVDTAVDIQHNKVIIVDGVSVQNGSFNFTRAAQISNAENITIHRGFPQLAEVFTRNWMFLWNQAQDFSGRY